MHLKNAPLNYCYFLNMVQTVVFLACALLTDVR